MRDYYDTGHTNGDEIDNLTGRSSPGTNYDRRSIVTPLSLKVRSALRRSLQENANRGFIGRRKRGVFDVSSSRRIAIGDTRIFRERTGPRGALDFSLVLCLDASSSVHGVVGDNIANAGLAVYEAASGMDGVDVALCVYGNTVIRSTPFGWDKDATKRSKRDYSRMAAAIHGGDGGGTGEHNALVWARSASMKRNAQQAMILVLTDGGPNSREAVAEQVQFARHEGIVTGGIGVMYQPPSYHEYNGSVDSLDQLPSAVTTLVRTMMRASR